MSTMRMLSGASVTQSTAAVVSLLKFLGKTTDPLPEVVRLPEAVLVLSNKKDVFYFATAASCSCPSAMYRPGQKCKHQRKYFPENRITRQSISEIQEQANENLTRMPKRYQAMVSAAREASEDDPGSIKPTGKWPGGFNGPVDLDEIKANAAPNEKGA